MGVIASKFAFMPPDPPGPLHADCKQITTQNGDRIPIGYPHTMAAESESYSPSPSSSTSSSKPTPSEQSCYDSIDAAYNYAKNTLGFDAAHQIWMGQSIGSGPTVDFAARRAKEEIFLAGMILISPSF